MEFIEKELYEFAQISAEMDKRMEKLQELSRQLCREKKSTDGNLCNTTTGNK